MEISESNQNQNPDVARSKRRLGSILAVVFAIALLMGPGPGILLVNSPRPVLGFPAIYLWGLVWYVVEVAVVVLAYLFVWTDD